MYEDKTLVCKECGAEFVFTAGEQEFYAEKGLKTTKKHPKRDIFSHSAGKNRKILLLFKKPGTIMFAG